MKTKTSIENIIKDLPKGIINWYRFRKPSKALLIYSPVDKDSNESLLQELQARCKKVKVKKFSDTNRISSFSKFENTYDYIVAINVLEYSSNPSDILRNWKRMLRPSGKLLIGTDNRLGLKYFCGDRDPFSNRSFDGVENYRRMSEIERKALIGRIYTKSEIEAFLNTANLLCRKFYSVLPNLKMPQLIYAESTLPEEELSLRLMPRYNHPDSVFLKEQFLYTDLIQNGLFHKMANAYLIECSLDNSFDNVEHVTLSTIRGRKNSFATIIRDDGTVEKKVLSEEAIEKLDVLKNNERSLIARGLNVVEGTIKGKSYIMPYIDSELVLNYLQRLAMVDLEGFKEKVEQFLELILMSSNIKELNGEVVFEKGYLDLVPWNCFYVSGEFKFFDQEFSVENYPVKAIIYRAIDGIYSGNKQIENILPKGYFLEKHDLNKKLKVWKKEAREFVEQLNHMKELKPFFESYQNDPEVLNTNRTKVNYSADEYNRLFVDIFRNLGNKRIILFGSGKYADRFIVQFSKKHPIHCIVDNRKNRWGTSLKGISIESPDILNQLSLDNYRLIVCAKQYNPIVRKLEAMRINEYFIYDIRVNYLDTCSIDISHNEQHEKKPKKYKIGYISGVFDLFHIGHLNLIKRAKEKCVYLIVGVMTDEGVKRHKKKEVFIPFNERVTILESCTYVDKVVEIPEKSGGIRDAYNMYRFDCQFVGSDYMDDSNWLADKAYLEKNGSYMEFLSYTEKTSSTKIRKMIDKKLI